jgi:ankyrin repeat protein
MQRRTTLSLHQAISNHAVTENHLSDDELLFGVDTKIHGHPPLHLAAREGLLHPVIKLLLACATVDALSNPNSSNPRTPLYLAMEYGHPLIAQVLLIYGANKETAKEIARLENNIEILNEIEALQIDAEVLTHVLFQLLEKSTKATALYQIPAKTLFTRIFTANRESLPLNTLRGLIELAYQTNTYCVSEEVLTLTGNTAVTNSDNEAYTAMFWCLVENAMLHPLETNYLTSEDALLTLHQLKIRGHEDEFNEYLNNLPKSTQEKYLEYALNYHEPANHLTARENYLYTEAAKANDLTYLKKYKFLEQEISRVLDYAQQKNNLVAVHALTDLVNATLFLTANIATDNTPYLKMLLLNYQIDLYKFALELPPEDLDIFVKQFWSVKGLVNSIVSRGIKPGSLPLEKSKLIFNRYSEVGITALSTAIHNRYGIKFNDTVVVPQNGIYEVLIKDALEKRAMIKVAQLYARFGMHITAPALARQQNLSTLLPDVIWHQIILYIGINEIKKFLLLCTEAKNYFLQIKQSSANKQNLIWELEYKIERFQEMQNQIDEEVDAKQWLIIKVGMLFPMLLAILEASSAYPLYQALQGLHKIADTVVTVAGQSSTCLAQAQAAAGGDGTDYTSVCDQYYDDFLGEFPEDVFKICLAACNASTAESDYSNMILIMGIPGSVLFIIAALTLMMVVNRKSFSWDTKFSNYSKELNTMAKEDDFFSWIDTNRNVKEIYATLFTKLNDLQKEYFALVPKQQMLIEVVADDITATTQQPQLVAPSSSNLSYARHRLFGTVQPNGDIQQLLLPANEYDEKDEYGEKSEHKIAVHR